MATSFNKSLTEGFTECAQCHMWNRNDETQCQNPRCKVILKKNENAKKDTVSGFAGWGADKECGNTSERARDAKERITVDANHAGKTEFFEPCQIPTATAQQRRHVNGHTFMPANVRSAQAMYYEIMARNRPGKPIQEPVQLTIKLIWAAPKARQKKTRGHDLPKTTKPDLDNMAKLIIDAGTKAGWWEDDSRIAALTLEKWETTDIAGIYVSAHTIKTQPRPAPAQNSGGGE